MSHYDIAVLQILGIMVGSYMLGWIIWKASEWIKGSKR